MGPYYRLVYIAAGPGERAAAWQDILARLNKLEISIPRVARIHNDSRQGWRCGVGSSWAGRNRGLLTT